MRKIAIYILLNLRIEQGYMYKWTQMHSNKKCKKNLKHILFKFWNCIFYIDEK